MDIEGLDFLLTYACVSQCSHCLYHAHPQAQGVMTVDDAQAYLNQAGEIQWISIHGGEPFLYFETLLGIIESAQAVDIGEIWVMTNCYWAHSFSHALEKLRKVKEAGCTHIWISADAFHQDFIPLERVKIALKASRACSFENIIVNSLYLASDQDQNKFNKKTRHILSELGSLDDTITRWESFSIGVALSVVGRAAETLAPLLDQTPPPQGACVLPPYLGKDIDSPQAFEIDPYGWVLLCPGVSVGNAKKTSLSHILNTYDPTSIPILNILREDGPKGLLKEAEMKGYTPGMYVNECHMCYEVRKFLRKDYPNLVPGICYGE